jgi:DNA polymerase-1
VDEIRRTSAPIALDTETYDPTGADEALDVRAAKVRLIQIKTEDGEAHVVDVNAVSPAPILEALREKPLILHNAAYDLAVLRNNYSYVHGGPVSDPMIVAQVLYAGEFALTTNLKDLLSRALGLEVSKEEQRSNWGATVLSDEQLRYAATDVAHLHELDDVLRARVKKSKGMEDVVDLENKMVKVVAEMAALGMPVDEGIFAECVSESEKGAAEQLAILDGLVSAPIPEDFITKNTKNKRVPDERNDKVNWNSPQQSLWAFKSAGINISSTNKKALPKVDHPLARALRAYRKAGDINRRFRNTKIEGGRAHATWKQVEAETGRMACEKPPMQGISKPLRRAFVAPAGHKLIVSDLSQIEVRVMCALSGDDNLRQEFIAGKDIHRAVAANVLGIPREEVTDEQRSLANPMCKFL